MSEDYLNNLTDKQKELVEQLRETASQMMAWQENAPDLTNLLRLITINMLAARQEQNGEGMAEEEINRICEWAAKRYLDMTLLTGIAQGHLGVRWDGDSEQPMFWLTKNGKEYGATLAATEDVFGTPSDN
ncbi:hypothetical protein EBZ39_00335 [bacterium]|nr:hypothetical protein [bacterium]